MEVSITLPDGSTARIQQPEGYIVAANGIYEVSQSSTSRISDLIWVDANIRYRDDPLTQVRIKFLDAVTGGVLDHSAPRGQLLEDHAAALIKDLMNKGATTVPGKKIKVLNYLQSFQLQGAEYAVKRIGWFTDTIGAKGFALPTKIITEGERTIYLPECKSPVHNSIFASCSIEDEKRYVSDKCKGNPYLIFVRGLACSGPFLNPLNLAGGGFNLYGLSSMGKTTALQVGASVWGNGSDPEENPTETVIQRWNTTANALEGVAQSANDIFLPLDEVGSNKMNDLGQVIYNLAGGIGKTSMTSDRQMRESYSWKTQIGSTGEYPMEWQVENSKSSKSTGGQRIRILDIALPDDIFQDTGGLETKVFVDKLKANCGLYFGATGEVLIKHLVSVVNDPERSLQLREGFSEACISLDRPGLENMQGRAQKRFAVVLLALQTSINLGLINISPDEAQAAVGLVFDCWLENCALISDVDRGIENIKRFIQTTPHRIRDANDATVKGANKLVGYKDSRNQRYLILKSEFQEVCGVAACRDVLKLLDEQGYLYKNNTNNNGTQRPSSRHYVAGVGSVTAYAIPFSFFGDVSPLAAVSISSLLVN